MNISEKNLFDFIFAPQNLSLEMKNHIELNRNLFREELQLVEDIYEKTQKNFDIIPEEKIKSRIFFSTPGRSILLNKIVTDIQEKRKGFVLAAQTFELKEDIIETETFTDGNSNYYLKIITKGNLSKIYIFEKNEKLLEKIRLTFLPSNLIINLGNNKEAYSVRNLEIPESVLVTFG